MTLVRDTIKGAVVTPARRLPARALRMLALAVIAGLVPPAAIRAAEDGPALLVVQNGGRQLTLDAAALAGMARHRVATSTIWTDGTHVFEGPSLHDLLTQAGILEGTVRLTALNSYSVDIPVSEVSATAPIIADRIDGQPFSVRDNGPLWLIYPYDDGPEFQTEVVYARSIWQLSAIALLPE